MIYSVKKKLIISGSIMVLILITMISCNSKESRDKKNNEDFKLLKNFTFIVEPVPEWTEVFNRNSGWFGGDGIFAIPYSGKDNDKESDSILFVFSDTMVGEIIGDSLVPGYSMVNNSLALYEKGKAPKSTQFFLAKDNKGQATTIITPNSKNGDYYWFGDGFVNATVNDKLYLFSYRIRNTDTNDQFPFEEVGNDLLVIGDKTKLPFKDIKALELPFFQAEGSSQKISFGAGIYSELEEDEYLYIYGVRGKNKELVCARVKPQELENFKAWEFRQSDGWSDDRENLISLGDSVSNELSVSKLAKEKYALVYQHGGILPKIYMKIGKTPFGPFGERIEIWDTTNDIKDPDLFTYNAKAHPAISEEGELLISYNVNSFKFFDIIENKPNLYRPRFIRVRFKNL